VAVLNPPRVLPGLGRAIVNFLIESRSSWDDARLLSVFKPPGLNDDVSAADGVKNTLSAFRAIGMLENDAQGNIPVASSVTGHGSSFGRTTFRRLMLAHVLDIGRDGDPWSVGEGEASTSGARDLTRALSWFLAQDALGAPLSWVDNIQKLQPDQFGTTQNDKWALTNDTRWGAFSRWAPALGLAVPCVLRVKQALVPLPTLAVADAVDEMPAMRMPIQEFLRGLAQKLPVLPGGVIRNGLVTRLGKDPDPGIQANTVDTSVAQVLRLLESHGRLAFESLADADGVQLSHSDQARTTHVTLKGGKKK
jgi:hypothetical protein